MDTNTIGVPTRVNIGGMPMAITGSVIGALAAFYIVRKIKPGPGLRLNHAPRTRKGPRGTADTAFFDISWGKTVNNFQLFIAKTDI